MKHKLQQQNWLMMNPKKKINPFPKKGIKHCLSYNVSICDEMPIPNHIHEKAALFCSLTLASRASKISFTVMKRRGELISIEIIGNIFP